MESKRSKIVVSKVNGKYGIIVEGQFYCPSNKSAEEVAETLAREVRMGNKSYTAPEEVCRLAGLPGERVRNTGSGCQLLPDGVCLEEVNPECARVKSLKEFFRLYANEFEHVYADMTSNSLDRDTLRNLMFDFQTDLAMVGDEIKERMYPKSKQAEAGDTIEADGEGGSALSGKERTN